MSHIGRLTLVAYPVPKTLNLGPDYDAAQAHHHHR